MANVRSIGLGTQLRHLLELLDGDLEKIYARMDGGLYRPRFTPVMRALESGESLSVKVIAERAGITHSAASQTVLKMASCGLVDVSSGDDARSRDVRLSARGRRLLPRLQRQWQATREAAEHLDAELGGRLVSTLDAAIEALQNKPFEDRIQSILRNGKRQGS
jgi:MarR family transcriptional regulator, organic hydroperoxide resistance regulator